MKYMLLTGLLLGSLTVQAQVSGTVKDQAGRTDYRRQRFLEKHSRWGSHS